MVGFRVIISYILVFFLDYAELMFFFSGIFLFEDWLEVAILRSFEKKFWNLLGDFFSLSIL